MPIEVVQTHRINPAMNSNGYENPVHMLQAAITHLPLNTVIPLEDGLYLKGADRISARTYVPEFNCVTYTHRKNKKERGENGKKDHLGNSTKAGPRNTIIVHIDGRDMFDKQEKIPHPKCRTCKVLQKWGCVQIDEATGKSHARADITRQPSLFLFSE